MIRVGHIYIFDDVLMLDCWMLIDWLGTGDAGGVKRTRSE